MVLFLFGVYLRVSVFVRLICCLKIDRFIRRLLYVPWVCVCYCSSASWTTFDGLVFMGCLEWLHLCSGLFYGRWKRAFVLIICLFLANGVSFLVIGWVSIFWCFVVWWPAGPVIYGGSCFFWVFGVGFLYWWVLATFVFVYLVVGFAHQLSFCKSNLCAFSDSRLSSFDCVLCFWPAYHRGCAT